MEKKVSESFTFLYVFLFVDILALDFREDNLGDILGEKLEYLNNCYSEYFRISLSESNSIQVGIIDYKKITDLDSNIIKSLEILALKKIDDEILEYIDINLSGHYKYKIKILFLALLGKFKRSSFLYEYSLSQKNEDLKHMFLLIYYGVGSYDVANLRKSIEYIDALLLKYPTCVSLYLLKIRQKFDLIYRCLLGKTKFNKLVSSEKGREFLYKQELIQECLEEFDKADSIYPNNSTLYFFKGKFLLHLLDKSGIECLYKFLEIQGFYYDFDVFSWIGVYYLQIGDAQNAKFYIDISSYALGDKYKEYGKKIYYHILKNNFESFDSFMEEGDFQPFLYRDGEYYELKNGGIEKSDFQDEVYLSAKMGFKLHNFDAFLATKYENNEKFLESVYDSVSKHFYDHWTSDIYDKVVFVYPEYRSLVGGTIAK